MTTNKPLTQNTGAAVAVVAASSQQGLAGSPFSANDLDPKFKWAYRNRGLLNLLKMGHCAPTVIQTILDLTATEQEWLVKLAAGMPGGIGNTGFECGGLTSPLVLLGLRYGLGAPEQGLPLIFYKGHDYRQRFWARHGTLCCSAILGNARFPCRCIGVVRHVPELYAETIASDSLQTIPDAQQEAYRQLYEYMTGNGFHCAHAVLQQVDALRPISRELLDGAAAFMGGTIFMGMTCSALTAGVMAVGLRLGEIENNPLRVARMLALMSIRGNAFADNINKFNRTMNIGNKLAHWFTNEFGSTQCRAITQCDFACAAGVCQYKESGCITKCKLIAKKVAQQVQHTIELEGVELSQ
ncbi:MAG: C_GCAxxG_C_C family protein [Caldilinea sp. CFX5]|nr:C_GCAxxG_C_C family protein [Caldilinea sp. CFX5]